MKQLQLLLLALCMPLLASAQYVSKVWSPDNGDGTYTNPVINADYSDPDVCVGASGKDYYLTASSFQCVPGLPILHSKDLVNWEIINYALTNLYEGDEELQQHFSTPQHGNGVWAPSIRYHKGWYYIYWGDPDYGVFMVRTQDPAGKWEAPVCVIKGTGYIDTTPLWDDDGRCYLVNGWANSRSKFASVLTVREMSADGTRAIGEPVIVFDGNGNENRTCEGPKFYKRDGWYWIMCPAGGVPTGFQLAMRSRSPYGPYEHKIVLAQGKTNINGPHQGAWVHTRYGEDWFLHFQDKEAYGRVVHLNPVDWSTGWPIMGINGEPVTTYKKPKSSSNSIVNPAESDEFNGVTLGKQWQWHANYDEKFGTATAFGTYRIYNHKLSDNFVNFWEVPNLLLQKTPADKFTATTKLRFTSKAEGQMGGLVMMGLDYSALVVKRVGQAFQLLQITCKAADKGKPQREQLIATLKPTAMDNIDYKPGLHMDIYLRLNVDNSKLNFAYSLDGKQFIPCGTEFQMREGKWIGAKFGYVSVDPNAKTDRGWIDADWIRIEPNKELKLTGDAAYQWVSDHLDSLASSYLTKSGNILDPDLVREELKSIGYNGLNVTDYIMASRQIDSLALIKLIERAEVQGNKTVFFMMGPTAAGKSTALRNNPDIKRLASKAGLVYDGAFISVPSFETRLRMAQKRGFKVSVIYVHNDVETGFSNMINRMIKSNRSMSYYYYVNSYPRFQGRIAYLQKEHPDLTLYCLDNSHNKGGIHVSIDEAKKWDYTVTDSLKSNLSSIMQQFIDSGQLTPAQIKALKE